MQKDVNIHHFNNVSSSKIHWSRTSSNRSYRSRNWYWINLLITNFINSPKPCASRSIILIRNSRIRSCRSNWSFRVNDFIPSSILIVLIEINNPLYIIYGILYSLIPSAGQKRKLEKSKNFFYRKCLL